MFKISFLVCLLAFARGEYAPKGLFPPDGACDGEGPRNIGVGDTFATPNYPGNYDGDEWCEWLATREPGSSNMDMVVLFEDFALEDCPDCECDYVEVFSGPTDAHPSIGRYCGGAGPASLSVPGDDMLIRFVSDRFVHFRGFQATIDEMDTACDSGRPKILVEPGTIMSPTHPCYYPANSWCSWLMIAPEGQRVRFTVNSFRTAEDCCSCDTLAIHDGEDTTATQKGLHYYRDRVPVIESTGRELFVEFRSNSGATDEGFTADFDFFSDDDNDTI